MATPRSIRALTLCVLLVAGAAVAFRLALAGPAGDVEPVTYFIAEGAPDSGYREGDRTLARWALEAWAAEADPALRLERAPEESARMRVYWVRASDGLYGEARARMVDGQRGADVFVRPDLRGLGVDIEGAAADDPLFRETIVYLTCVHELGHAFGLPHTSAYADIMYSFQHGGDFVAYFRRFRDRLERREDIPNASPFSAADIETFRTLSR